MIFDGEIYEDENEGVDQEWICSTLEATIDEVVTNIASLHLSAEHPAIITPQDEKDVKMKNLESKVRSLEERNAKVKEKLRREKLKSERYQVALRCIMCMDPLRNAQSLECGHSACYACLRRMWTRTAAVGETESKRDSESIISTDEEEAGGEPGEPDTESPNSSAPSRRRHRFLSVVEREKVCPSCRKPVIRRPIQDRTIRDIIESMNSGLRPSLSRTQSSTQREDLWHGIFPFPQEHTSTGGPRLTLLEILLSEYYFAPPHMMYIRASVDNLLKRREQDVLEVRGHQQRMKSTLDKLIAERDQGSVSRTTTHRDIPDTIASLMIRTPNFVTPPDEHNPDMGSKGND